MSHESNEFRVVWTVDGPNSRNRERATRSQKREDENHPASTTTSDRWRRRWLATTRRSKPRQRSFAHATSSVRRRTSWRSLDARAATCALSVGRASRGSRSCGSRLGRRAVRGRGYCRRHRRHHHLTKPCCKAVWIGCTAITLRQARSCISWARAKALARSQRTLRRSRCPRAGAR